MLRALLSLFVLSSFSWAASFDQPVSQRTIDLGPSRSNPAVHAKVTCYYFRSFTVKEVDGGEKGAERLAIVPQGKNKLHTCSRLRDEGEKVINPDDWSGYFMGVKGDLVFFSADDGWNGGMGFAIYDAKSGRKIFDDVALGDLEFVNPSGSAITLRYIRVVDGGCVLPKDQAACWDAIRKKFAFEAASMPDCKNSYEKSAEAIAQGRCQAQNADNPQCLAKEIPLARQQSNGANSVIAYPAEVVVAEGVLGATVKPLAGDLRCWPSD